MDCGDAGDVICHSPSDPTDMLPFPEVSTDMVG